DDALLDCQRTGNLRGPLFKGFGATYLEEEPARQVSSIGPRTRSEDMGHARAHGGGGDKQKQMRHVFHQVTLSLMEWRWAPTLAWNTEVGGGFCFFLLFG